MRLEGEEEGKGGGQRKGGRARKGSGGVSEWRSVGVVWCSGRVGTRAMGEISDGGKEGWNGGAMELWSGGTVEWGSRGEVERWSGRAGEGGGSREAMELWRGMVERRKGEEMESWSSGLEE